MQFAQPSGDEPAPRRGEPPPRAGRSAPPGPAHAPAPGDGWGTGARRASGWLTLFLIGTDLFVMSPLLPIIAERYRVDVATAGWALTSFSVPYMLAAPLLGGLSDRHGRRRIMVAGLLCFGGANLLTTLVCSLTDGFVALLLARATAGLSAAAITPSVYAATGDMAPPERRASWLALVGSGPLIAITLGAPLGGLVAAALGLRAVFATITLACFALAALNARAWPSGSTLGSPPGPGPGPAGSFTAPTLLGAVGPTVLWSASLFGAYTYLAGGLAAATGATAADAALVIVGFGVGTIAGNLSGGRAADRFGPESVIVTAYAGLGLCWLAVAGLVRAGHDGATRLPVAAGFALAAFVAQHFWPAQQARLAHLFTARRGALLAWNNSALYLGMSLGAALGGPVLLRAGFGALLHALAALSFASALLFRVGARAARARRLTLASKG